MKVLRQRKIIELINSEEIETQEDLAVRLRDCGFDVTQATISRDIRELNLNKTPGSKGKQKYSVLTPDAKMDKSYINALKDTVVSIEAAENIIIVKTGAGMAMAVASVIDSLNVDGIVGCIAGDDTIMCVVKYTGIVPEVLKELSGIFERLYK